MVRQLDAGYGAGFDRTHNLGDRQSSTGKWSCISPADAVFLADRPVVFYAARDLCAWTERFPFYFFEPAVGTFHTADERPVRFECISAPQRIELSLECAARGFVDDAGWNRRTCFYYDGIAGGKLCILSRHAGLAADGFREDKTEAIDTGPASVITL